MNYYNQIKQKFLDNIAYHEVKEYSKNRKDVLLYNKGEYYG